MSCTGIINGLVIPNFDKFMCNYDESMSFTVYSLIWIMGRASLKKYFVVNPDIPLITNSMSFGSICMRISGPNTMSNFSVVSKSFMDEN